MTSDREKIIFFGNGALADYALAVLSEHFEIVFHARTREDLEKARELRAKNPKIHGVLASFGVMVPEPVLEVFEPEGILNIHPSLLPLYRGASPIESAILDGDVSFSVSIMKLVKVMDAGPIYYQTTFSSAEIAKITGSELVSGLIPEKKAIYQVLAEAGAKWICEHLTDLPEPVLQDDSKATFCGKLDKSMGVLTPEIDSAEKTLRKIIAFAGFPKAKHEFFGINCIIHGAHITKPGETAVLEMQCADGRALAIDSLQPEGRKVMNVKSFVNGYKK